MVSSFMRRSNRPKDVSALQVWRCGPSKNNLDFIADTGRAYFLERPVGVVAHDRGWNYLLFRGDENFDAGKSELLRVVR